MSHKSHEWNDINKNVNRVTFKYGGGGGHVKPCLVYTVVHFMNAYWSQHLETDCHNEGYKKKRYMFVQYLMKDNLRWQTEWSSRFLLDTDTSTNMSCFPWLAHSNTQYWPSHPCYTNYCMNVHIAVLSYNTEYTNRSSGFTNKGKSVLSSDWLQRKRWMCTNVMLIAWLMRAAEWLEPNLCLKHPQLRNL